jgi:putative hemolysin
LTISASADFPRSSTLIGVGDGAVIDHHFGTTDVLIVMPVAAINMR